MSSLRIQLVQARANDLNPHERKQLAADLLADLQLELFGEGGVQVKLCHQVLTDTLTDDTVEWLKGRAFERGLDR